MRQLIGGLVGILLGALIVVATHEVILWQEDRTDRAALAVWASVVSFPHVCQQQVEKPLPLADPREELIRRWDGCLPILGTCPRCKERTE